MERKSMGSFLGALRRANGMTQQEVADILNVSNKTVSKWERDDGCPEIMMLPAIAELYDVTTDEILRGERISKDENSPSAKTKGLQSAKLAIGTTMLKMKNCTIICAVLCALSFALLILSSIFYYENVVLVLALLLGAASFIICLIGANRALFSLNNRCEADSEPLNLLLRESLLSVYKQLIATLYAASICICAVPLKMFFYSPLPIIFFMIVLLGIFYLISRPLKTYVVGKIVPAGDEQTNPQKVKLRSRFTKLTIIVCCAATLLFPLVPAAATAIEATRPKTFTFTDPEKYNLILGMLERHSEHEVYILTTANNNYSYDALMNPESEHEWTGELYLESLEDEDNHCSFSFDTPEQAKEFLEQNVIVYDQDDWYKQNGFSTVDFHYIFSATRLSFDENTLKIKAYPNRVHTSSHWRSFVQDGLFMYLLAGAVFDLVFILIINGVYRKKIKRIDENHRAE